MAVSALSRLNQKPYVLGSAATMWGWARSALHGLPRYENSEFRAYLRRYQARALLVGKRAAIEEIDHAADAAG